MSYIPFANIGQSGSFPQQPTRTYIATAAFNTKLLVYSTSVNSNFVTVGSLTVNPSATAALCPRNEVLHTNGKFLRPDVNPGVVKPLIGVYSPRTFLSGFIDPTDPTFARYDVNFPYFFDVGVSSPTATLAGQGANVRGGEDAGYQLPTTNFIDAGNAMTGESSLGPTYSTLTISSQQVTTSSRIFLQKTGGAISTSGLTNYAIPYVSNISNGSFQVWFPSAVATGDRQYFAWFVLK
ncbi:MAG: hypothetical protein EBU82_07720 [Flavobacteriia bacterium]|jgi:hypothetical protein|nr:hypothetical protein [Flavobacteriia bacterium]